MKRILKIKCVLFLAVFFAVAGINLTTNVRSAKAIFGVGDIVFDPATWLESLLDYLETAAQTLQNELDSVQQTIQSYEAISSTIELVAQTRNQLKELSNQVEQIKNQGTQISNQVKSIAQFDTIIEEWVKNLMKLEENDFYDFVEKMGEDMDALEEQIIKDSRGYVKDYENVQDNYDETFSTFAGDDALTPEAMFTKQQEWNEILIHTSFDSTKAAEILSNSTLDTKEVTNALNKINKAEGTVGVLQGMAGLDVVRARQNAEMRYLMVSLNQQLGVQAAVEASEREQDRRDSARFFEEAGAYTEIGGQSLEELGARELGN